MAHMGILASALYQREREGIIEKNCLFETNLDNARADHSLRYYGFEQIYCFVDEPAQLELNKHFVTFSYSLVLDQEYQIFKEPHPLIQLRQRYKKGSRLKARHSISLAPLLV